MPAPIVGAAVAMAKAGLFRKAFKKFALPVAVLLVVPGLLFGALFFGVGLSMFWPGGTGNSEPTGGSAGAGASTAEWPDGVWGNPMSAPYGISSYFGMRDIYPPNHKGIDLSTGVCGSEIRAVASGVVEFAGWTTGGWGNRVIIQHPDNTATAYGHLVTGSIVVAEGDLVHGGQHIGGEGDTGISGGCHLHFEAIVGGTRVDPLPYLAARGVPL